MTQNLSKKTMTFDLRPCPHKKKQDRSSVGDVPERLPVQRPVATGCRGCQGVTCEMGQGGEWGGDQQE